VVAGDELNAWRRGFNQAEIWNGRWRMLGLSLASPSCCLIRLLTWTGCSIRCGRCLRKPENDFRILPPPWPFDRPRQPLVTIVLAPGLKRLNWRQLSCFQGGADLGDPGWMGWTAQHREMVLSQVMEAFRPCAPTATWPLMAPRQDPSPTAPCAALQGFARGVQQPRPTWCSYRATPARPFASALAAFLRAVPRLPCGRRAAHRQPARIPSPKRPTAA